MWNRYVAVMVQYGEQQQRKQGHGAGCLQTAANLHLAGFL
jgi:hypothetical protein